MVRRSGISPFWKDILREISNTKGRFISILLITMLGAMLVVGIHATAINMRDAADNAYRHANLYDLQIRFSNGDAIRAIETIRQEPAVYKAMSATIFDVYVNLRETQRIIRLTSLPDTINQVELISGRLPQAPNEIVVERRLLRGGQASIGDTIEVYAPWVDVWLSTTELTIVGVVESPLYLTGDRGNTHLGAGTVHYYAYVHPYIFSMGYTDIFVVMRESRYLHQVSHEYNEAAQEWRRWMETTVQGYRAFVFTRQNGTAFESYFQDTLRLEQVGYVFPLLFFLVAVLVALTSISRMVEEQRGQIGIYKALGYSGSAIMLKYVVYAVACGLAGGILGVVLGSQLIPRIIFNAYEHMYNMPHSNHPIPWGVSAIAVMAAVGSILAAALFTCINTLKGEAATLMRPKSPKAGKRVLLERIPFIWNHMGFISKVTSRNIFRYKRRFFMTLAGVAGCTALLLVAFGLRDSIGSVAQIQFDDISIYDFQLHLRDVTTTQQNELLEFVQGESLFIRTITANAHSYAGGFSATIIIPQDFSALPNFINLVEPSRGFQSWTRGRSEPIQLQSYDEGVFVTEKLAREMNIQAGDYFFLTTGDGQSYRVRAAGIVENYVLHYVYMPMDYYIRLFGREFVANGMFVIGDVDTSMQRHDSVLALVNTAFMRDNLSNQTDALGVVTIVILVMACILAFVVLYNLTEINIIERMREIATIKVLGFHDIETAMYLYRENMIVTAMGITLGLVGGVALNGFVLTTVEIDLLKFPHIIYSSSFLLAIALSVLFAMLVNVATYHRLIDIDMVTALKSVE